MTIPDKASPFRDDKQRPCDISDDMLSAVLAAKAPEAASAFDGEVE
ncbi:MAG: hypothetical protein WAN43_09585 [Rhodomicrobium sp.]|jgi:hypothetical protein